MKIKQRDAARQILTNMLKHVANYLEMIAHLVTDKLSTHSATGTHILLEGLTPAQTYWFRVRAIGSGGKGVWTDPVSVIVT